MKYFLFKSFLLLLNFYLSNAFISSLMMNSEYKPSAHIKHIEYSTAYNALNKWSIANKRRYMTDMIWLTKCKSKSTYQTSIMLGLYNSDNILNYICYLEILKEKEDINILKLQNIFSNPLNKEYDDYNLILSLKQYSIKNKLLINDDNLKKIHDGRYFLTVMYYSFISCS